MQAQRADWRGSGSGSLRARADKTAQPTGRFSHQVHGPTVCSQGEEHVITHILVIIHLPLGKKQRQAKKVCQIKPPTATSALTQSTSNTVRNLLHSSGPGTGYYESRASPRGTRWCHCWPEMRQAECKGCFCESGGHKHKMQNKKMFFFSLSLWIVKPDPGWTTSWTSVSVGAAPGQQWCHLAQCPGLWRTQRKDWLPPSMHPAKRSGGERQCEGRNWCNAYIIFTLSKADLCQL